MNERDIEMRAQRAVELFKQGYNCSQAVFTSCADIYGITDESLALRLSASFGGGMNYAFVQQLAGEFKGKYGSLICGELLGLAPKGQCNVQLDLDPRPAERTQEYYEKRPCPEMIAEAVRIYLRSL